MKIIIKKGEDMMPVKSIFRVYNPERTNEQALEEEIYKSVQLSA